MSLPRRRHFRSRSSGQSGFTLVELLVVIGIIAILAGVALGPITQGLEKAKESAGMQTARTICLAMFQFEVDNQNFPGYSNSEGVAAQLINGNYISDPSIFAQDKSHAYTGTLANLGQYGTGFQTGNVCWDFIVESAQNSAGVNYGLSASDPDAMPAVFSTGQTVTIPTQGPGSAVTMGGTANPFGNNGMAVCYKSNSAAFLKAVNNNATYQVNTQASNYLFSPSFSCTPGNYLHVTP